LCIWIDLHILKSVLFSMSVREILVAIRKKESSKLIKTKFYGCQKAFNINMGFINLYIRKEQKPLPITLKAVGLYIGVIFTVKTFSNVIIFYCKCPDLL